MLAAPSLPSVATIKRENGMRIQSLAAALALFLTTLFAADVRLSPRFHTVYILGMANDRINTSPAG
jgi:hypothetical protein